MKKIISLALCCVIAASAFASCAQTPAKNYSPKITVSSSEADTYASWLTNRLGDSLENSVYLALGNDSGIDLSNFENDGYVIRTDGASAVIAGKTASGLDMAVRKYANEVDAGRADALDIAYHEGNRIDELRLAGTNIAEYAIEYPAEHNGNMLYAISEMQRLIKKATGVELSSSEGITDRAHAIEFRFTEDESLGNDGYRYFFEGSRLVIEGAVARGCMYGAWFFLEKELDWRSLTYGNSYLPEAKLIDVSADTEEETTPILDLYTDYLWGYGGNFATDARDTSNSAQFSYGVNIAHACHGLQGSRWGGVEYVAWHQICYTDEDLRANIRDSIENHIASRLSGGHEIGKELRYIDVSQGDNGYYCHCTECMKIIKEEGATSGAVVRWANTLEEEISETYDGIMYLIFAYMGTQPPCKTAPNENVHVTFAMNGTCANHALDTKDCNEKTSLYAITEEDIINNDNFAEWVRGWCALSDNILIWYYAIGCHVQNYTMLDIMYDDIMFFKECGVRGLFIEQESTALGMQHIMAQLAYEINWNPDMTRDEYSDALDAVLRRGYGDGWAYIREYIDGIWQKSQDIAGHCWNCWGFGSIDMRGQYDNAFLAEQFDTSVWLFEKAESMALNSRQQRNCELLSVHMLYEGCVSSYFKEYDEGDTERIAVLDERYSKLIQILDKYGKNTNDLNYGHVSIQRTLEDSAWLDWAGWRDDLPQGETQRPASEKYADAE